MFFIGVFFFYLNLKNKKKIKYNFLYCKVCNVKNVVKMSEILIIVKIIKYII